MTIALSVHWLWKVRLELILTLFQSTTERLLSDAELSASESPMADKKAPGSERAAERAAAAQQNSERARLAQPSYVNMQVCFPNKPRSTARPGNCKVYVLHSAKEIGILSRCGLYLGWLVCFHMQKWCWGGWSCEFRLNGISSCRKVWWYTGGFFRCVITKTSVVNFSFPLVLRWHPWVPYITEGKK